jgi:hypothetical protein
MIGVFLLAVGFDIVEILLRDLGQVSRGGIVSHDEGCLGEGYRWVKTGCIAVAVLELTPNGSGCAWCSVIGCCSVQYCNDGEEHHLR